MKIQLLECCQCIINVENAFAIEINIQWFELIIESLKNIII